VGCAPANALYGWKKKKGLEKNIFQLTAASVFSYLLGNSADFLLYGPLSIAPWAFPACATAEAVRSYAARLEGIRPLTADHPLTRFL